MNVLYVRLNISSCSKGASTSTTENFGHRAKRARVSGKSQDLPGNAQQTQFCSQLKCCDISFRWFFINTGSLVPQSPQRSSTCRWSFQTRWFWKSSPICWSRTCVERPVCVNALVNWPMTPSSGRLGYWTKMHVCLFFSIN